MNKSKLKLLVHQCINEVLLEGRKICAWCKKDMGYFDDITGRDTHTICPECMKQYFPTYPEAPISTVAKRN